MSTKPAPRQLEGYVEIHTGQLHPNPSNPRRMIDDLDDLAASIHEHGLLQPLVVEELPTGGYRIIAGHRRYAALLRLARMWAPCIIRDPDETAQMVLALVENGQRRNLNPIEEATVLRHLRDTTDQSMADIARSVGRSQTWVTHRLQLLNLPRAEQEAIAAGEPVKDHQQAARALSPTSQPNREHYATNRPHFTNQHPLAADARILCEHAGHPVRGARHAGACEACWETAIRTDERGRR